LTNYLANDLRVEPVTLEDGVEPGEAVEQVVQSSLHKTGVAISWETVAEGSRRETIRNSNGNMSNTFRLFPLFFSFEIADPDY